MKSVRRACLHALRDQHTRLATRTLRPYLPPPRFSVAFCPFALQLQKDQTKGNANFTTKKVRPQDRYDEREICPYCDAHVCVSSHSGLPDHRRILFQSHTQATPATKQEPERATFACSSCYKTYDDSYAFLDHIFQKQIDSERSCLRRSSARFSITSSVTKSSPALVEKCLRNCLRREMTRAKMLKREDAGEKRDSLMEKEVQVTVRAVDSRYSTNTLGRG